MPFVEANASFVAKGDEVPALVDFVADQGGRAGLPETRLAHLRIAVEEIALNICNHAYGGSAGTLEIGVRGDAERFVTELSDEGPPFDPSAAPAPDVNATVRGRPIGGLGVLLVHRLMDEFRYRRDGGRNVVTLVVDQRQREQTP